MKKIYGILIILAVMLIQSEMIFADDKIEDKALNFEFVGRNEGLSNLSVSTIIQDKNGFLWFGTQGGLNRYDGREIKLLRNNPFESDGLVHNLIQTMYYDEEKHELWIGTYQGISKYIISENRFVNYTVENNNLSNPIVVAIVKDIKGDMWFGTMNGLNKLNKDTDLFENYKVSGEVVRSLLVDSKNRLLIGTYEGLCYFDYSDEGVGNISLDLPSPYVMVVKEFEAGTLTLGLWDGGVVEVTIETNETLVNTFDDNRVYSLLKTPNDTLWVGTWGGGLFTEDKQGKVNHYTNEGNKDSLAHNVVYSMAQDHSGIVWIGTNGGGINKINPRKNNFLKLAFDPEDDTSLGKGNINKIYEDRDENLWIAIYNNGLNVYNSKEGTIEKYIHDPNDPHSLPDNQINEIYEFDDYMLLGSNSGLVKFEKENKTFSIIKNLPKETLVYAIEQVNESEIWVGTYLQGVFVYNIEKETFKNIKSDDLLNPIADNLIYDIYVDSKSRIWIATNNGLNVKEAKSGQFKLFQKESENYSKLANNSVRTIYEDSQERIWIGMVGGGLAYFDEANESFVSFTEKDGLSSNIVTGIVEDDKGRIWVSTENGLSTVHPENREIFNLTPDDGIGGWEFSSDAIKTFKGSLLFAGLSGVTEIPESYMNVDLPEPKVYITDVFLFQEPIDENREIFNDAVLSFGANDSNLEFKVVALDFDIPLETRFAYKLEGFDDEWIKAGKRDYISYSNLPAGEYEFKVIAETPRKVVTKPVSLKFSIATVWYKSNLAYVFYILILILVFIILMKLREGKLSSLRNRELNAINDQLHVANSQLELLSNKDGLTNLFNRRYFDMMLVNHLKLSIRSSSFLSLILIDIDDFKLVNDQFGHVAGDYLIKDICDSVSGMLTRASDFAARYGGDEIAVVLYDTNEGDTLLIAETILSELRQVKVRQAYSSENYYITASIGIACEVPKFDSTLDQYVATADKALYKSKNAGKNRISFKTDR